jgi:hypothetical protein
MTASATPACAARADTALSMSAPLVLPFDATALPAELTEEGDPELDAVVGPAGKAATDFDGTAEDELEEEEEVVPFERAPMPQGMPSPPGWVRFGAATVVPVASAMAKRPVQRRSDALAAWENW